MSEIKQAMLDLIIRKGGVTYVELEELPGFKGELMHSISEQNIVLWYFVSDEFVSAYNDLVQNDIIEVRSTSVLCYLADGKTVNLPIAKSSKKKYKTPRWLPVEFNVHPNYRKTLINRIQI